MEEQGIAEVALSIVPLVAAGLMLRTFVTLTNAPIGVNPTDLLSARMGVSLRLFSAHSSRCSCVARPAIASRR